MLMYEREMVCQNCGAIYKDFDNDMSLCRSCWNSYVESQLRPTVQIRLTQEYVRKFLLTYGEDIRFNKPTNDFDFEVNNE